MSPISLEGLDEMNTRLNQAPLWKAELYYFEVTLIVTLYCLELPWSWVQAFNRFEFVLASVVSGKLSKSVSIVSKHSWYQPPLSLFYWFKSGSRRCSFSRNWVNGWREHFSSVLSTLKPWNNQWRVNFGKSSYSLCKNRLKTCATAYSRQWRYDGKCIFGCLSWTSFHISLEK